MELDLYSKIPDFENRMAKLVEAVAKLMSNDEPYKRQMMQARNHQVTNNGNCMEVWLTSLRSFSKLGNGREEAVFR